MQRLGGEQQENELTDRELLEAAAKAASIVAEWDESHMALMIGVPFRGVASMMNYEPWNPLRDDGDALRLAVKLGLQVGPRTAEAWRDGREVANIFEDDGDEETATRRAIVRAAAAMAAAPAVGAA